MALDAEIIGRVAEELNERLRDGRIEKIRQPEKDLLLFGIRRYGENSRLLIRAGGPNARMHLTERNYENPPNAPMFCMLLRKYLKGACILDIRQVNGDRIIVMTLEGRTELGDEMQLQLVTELMGRAANVILVGEDGRILDCLRRIAPGENVRRALLPGLLYELPEKPPSDRKPTAEEAPDAGESVSALLDARYGDLEQHELQRRRAQELTKTVRRMRDRQQRKLAAQEDELRRTENMEQIRQEAELLKANLYRVHRGDRTLSCENYYEPESPAVLLELDPLKSPQQNLENRYKRYRKAKGAREHLGSLIAEGEKLLDYLNSVLDELDRAESERDLSDIRRELETVGLLKKDRRERKQAKGKPQHATEYLRFESPDGYEILVGRNNAMNDELTTKIARRTDYWLHVKSLHGSHVILRCEGREPTETALKAAAELAVRYSQGRGGGKCAVDYTMVRNVKKGSGALPGKVTYQNYSTIIASSGED
ncbi:MAG: NFACT family protein [Candidatus Limivicinus sp.]